MYFSGSQDSEVSEEQKKEKIMELKKKEKLLQEKLLQKVEELKKICLREAVRAAPMGGGGWEPFLPTGPSRRALSVPQELTGKMPKEYPLSAGEEPPQVRRRVDTAFKLDDNLLPTEEVSAVACLHSRGGVVRPVAKATSKQSCSSLVV